MLTQTHTHMFFTILPLLTIGNYVQCQQCYHYIVLTVLKHDIIKIKCKGSHLILYVGHPSHKFKNSFLYSFLQTYITFRSTDTVKMDKESYLEKMV